MKAKATSWAPSSIDTRVRVNVKIPFNGAHTARLCTFEGCAISIVTHIL